MGVKETLEAATAIASRGWNYGERRADWRVVFYRDLEDQDFAPEIEELANLVGGSQFVTQTKP